MMAIKIKLSKKKILIFLSLFCILIFFLPVVIFGIRDLEYYYFGFFYNQFYNVNFYNPFVNFISSYGPGTRTPLGVFPYYHPIAIFFADNYKLFLSFSIVFNLFIQLIYFKKILKFFQVKEEYFIFSPIVIFSIANFNYVWSDEWPLVFYTYTFFFPCFYYVLKITKKDDFFSFLKLGLVYGFALINSHPGIFINFLVFLILFSILNNYFYLLKKKYFYISVIIAILIYSETLFYLISEYIKFDPDTPKSIHNKYLWLHYIASIGLPINFSNWTPINRYPAYGIIFFVSFYQALKMIISKKSKKYFFVDYIFLIILLITLTDYTKKIFIVSAVWQFRDILIILGVILFFIFFKNLKSSNFKNLLATVSLISIIIFYIGNFVKYIPYNNSTNNIVVKKEMNYDIDKYLKNFGGEHFDNKIYLSPDFYKDLNALKLRDYNLFSTTDLVNYNLAPFNGSFKAIYLGQISKPWIKMRTYLYPTFEEINNELFLSIFNIKYLAIYEEEIKNLKNLDNFNLLKKINVKIYENKNEKKSFFLDKYGSFYEKDKNKKNLKKLLILERKNYDDKVVINVEDLKKLDCKNEVIINCILIQENLFNFTQSVEIKKKSNTSNEFIFKNNSNETKYIVAPFVYDKNWKSASKESILHNEKKMMIIKVDKELSIKYSDSIRNLFRIIALSTLGLIFILVVFQKIKGKYFR